MQVNQLKHVSFKEIISHYRRQPQAKSDIFRTVVLAQSLPELQVRACGNDVFGLLPRLLLTIRLIH